MTGLDTELAQALGAEEDDARVAQARALAWARLDEAMRRPDAARRARRRRRPWLVPAAATLVVLGGSAAIAQTTGLADRLLGTMDDGADGRIDALDDSSAPGLTDAELEEIFDQGSMRRAVGDRLEGDDGVVGATIVDDRGGLRISLVRTERRGVCSVLSEGGPGAWTANSTACIGFPPGWPVNEGRSTPHAGTAVYYGVLADGVSTVRFHVDGEIVEPVVANGTYLYWPRTNVEPTAIDAVLEDGTVIRRDLVAHNEMLKQMGQRARFVSECMLQQEIPETQAMRDVRSARCSEAVLERFPDDRIGQPKPFVVTDE